MKTLKIARTTDELRLHADAWRALKHTIALVPTMGALHEGHLSLVETARRHADVVIVSVFVNPTQFAAGEDYDTYPRDLDGDAEKLRAAGVDLMYAPSVEEMYPQGFATTVHVEGPAKAGLEDAFRPTHFDGVATVVAKLLIQSGCHVAVFGEKDYQQLLVIKQLVRDLDLPVKIVPAPTMREADGLAMSSRNAYLSRADRERAAVLYRALTEAAAAIRNGASLSEACRKGRDMIENAGLIVDYFEARNAETLAPVEDATQEPLRLLVAARLGQVRLIDNIAVHET
ncbi:pantoate--beta-alanine ligase [Thermopetrobacter sp. TC1]|uniref:pantoate--beta-alanine ligase n=1 Tax=Thermopetrobacter sp. TC1 TaxID=1495045 RepID=UPI0005705ADA|nr:pantoate--beta-alanine ligase [Thermopetrobacter sp. TC1]